MAVFNGIFPIQEGKEDAARAFAAAVLGARKADFDALQARSNITRETWAMQETPMGNVMVVWFEGDVEKAFQDLAVDNSEFVTWFRGQVKDVTGVRPRGTTRRSAAGRDRRLAQLTVFGRSVAFSASSRGWRTSRWSASAPHG